MSDKKQDQSKKREVKLLSNDDWMKKRTSYCFSSIEEISGENKEETRKSKRNKKQDDQQEEKKDVPSTKENDFNIMVNWQDLSTFLCQNMKCKCRKK